MTFAEARGVSLGGLHVRRSAWSDPHQWFILWRGVWWYCSTGVTRPVVATDYSADDLRATDWTTVPAALQSCPVDTATGSTGGAPPSKFTLPKYFPVINYLIGVSNTPPGASLYGGDVLTEGEFTGTGFTTLPPPVSGKISQVTFAGFREDPAWTDPSFIASVSLDGVYPLQPASGGWTTGSLFAYHFTPTEGSPGYDAFDVCTVTRSGSRFFVAVQAAPGQEGDFWAASNVPYGVPVQVEGTTIFCNESELGTVMIT